MPPGRWLCSCSSGPLQVCTWACRHGLLSCSGTDDERACMPAAGSGAALHDIVSTAVHVTPMGTSVRPPAILAVSGPPRALPDAKDSLWATERAPLEAELPENATEGLLCTADGRALEGFVNNFFVVTGASCAACSHLKTVRSAHCHLRRSACMVCKIDGIADGACVQAMRAEADFRRRRQSMASLMASCGALSCRWGHLTQCSTMPVWTCRTQLASICNAGLCRAGSAVPGGSTQLARS